MLNKQLPAYQLWWFAGFALVSLACILGAFAFEQYLVLAVPFVLLFGYIAFINYRVIYWMLLFTLPLSTELDIGSIGLDMPDELLMVSLMFITVFAILGKPHLLDFSFVRHPVMLLLFTHLFLVVVLLPYSVNMLVTFKYILSKIWFYLPFLILTSMILKEEADLKKFFWYLFLPMTFTVLVVLVRYAGYGFAFEEVNKPMYPFYRNHVSYACMITIFYPFIWLAAGWYESGTWKKRILQWSKILYLVAIYLSYTRACYLAIVAIAVCYVIIHWNLLRQAIVAALVVVLLGVGYMVTDNNYLEFAPEYTKTVYHTEFGDHLKATVSLNDVSSMERVYRWVAAFRMINDRPVTGFGAGNFYPYYMRYTVSDFQTYTSDNPERSTAHNYFLLTLVEQGFPGLIIFLITAIAIFFYGQQAYARATDKTHRKVLMTCMLALVCVFVNLMLSDMIETDKVGSLYYMSISILIVYMLKVDRDYQKRLKAAE